MQTVNVTDLENNLNAYLEQVRNGEEITIKDQNGFVARLLPLAQSNHLDKLTDNPLDDLDEHEKKLVAAGEMALPSSALPRDFWEMPAPVVPMDKIIAAVQADRDAD